MSASRRKHLMWFSNDCRLHDNTTLLQASQQADALVCLYCIDQQWFESNRYGTKRMGQHRLRFLMETLHDLDEQLKKLGQRLVVRIGNPVKIVSELVQRYNIDNVYRSVNTGLYEQRQWQQLQHALPDVEWHQFDTHTLLDRAQVQQLESFPTTFSEFRRIVENWDIDIPMIVPAALPTHLPVSEVALNCPSTLGNGDTLFRGGETAAFDHCGYYFSSELPLTYLDTRNELDGWPHSSKLSPWLALGCLSPKWILLNVHEYQANHGQSKSVYWLFFELLWREYFQWYAHTHGSNLFAFKGIAKSAPVTTFYGERFRKWCQGSTPYPLVNACMKQLNSTGYLSNRGRQIAASCLVNELQCDWRAGAYYFEEQLTDYDAATNWGNWQYIAGVGADPRGGRHFNIEKQTELYDPDHDYIKRWQGHTHQYSMDSTDMVDWPILQSGKH